MTRMILIRMKHCMVNEGSVFTTVSQLSHDIAINLPPICFRNTFGLHVNLI